MRQEPRKSWPPCQDAPQLEIFELYASLPTRAGLHGSVPQGSAAIATLADRFKSRMAKREYARTRDLRAERDRLDRMLSQRLTKGNGLVTSISAGSNGALRKAKRKILLRGLASMDKRGEVAKVFREMRSALTDQYGGAEAITPAQEMLIEMFCRGKTYLNHVDVVLHELARLTNGTKRKAIPLLMERMSMAKILSGQLEQLGLERKTRVRSLQEDLDAQPELLDKEGQPL